MRYTKKRRQEIVEEFSRRHNGQYNPQLFLQEVRDTGKDHPAFGWFEWDQQKAANEFQLSQARDFARDLRVTFTVEEVGRTAPIEVKVAQMPLVISPVSGHKSGGGYVLTDPNDPAHQVEHCHQAATALRSWLNRYQAAVIHAGLGVKAVEMIAEALEKIEAPKADGEKKAA